MNNKESLTTESFLTQPSFSILALSSLKRKGNSSSLSHVPFLIVRSTPLKLVFRAELILSEIWVVKNH